MSQAGWRDTRLFSEIQNSPRIQREPEASAITAWLEGIMPDIETILRSAATSPTDFTLHNDQHAFRAAELMASIIPSETLTVLTTYEVALLLLSAYLHDIGMTPVQRRINDLTLLALGGEAGQLNQRDANDFRDWLVTSYASKAPNLGDPTYSDHARFAWARRSVAHYCRFKHNDWSEEWIRSHISPKADFGGSYPGFIDDLIALCRSHHEGYGELISSRFDPRLVGNNRLVHHRYLACVLRIADVCEVDPERTPQVILNHREIDSSSIPFWHKDHDLTVSVNDDFVRLVAYPRRALIHRAIEETADQIEEELRLCERLAADHPFTALPFRGLAGSHYEWKLTPYLHRTITPREGTYVYIDGSFRPNTEKVLQLLGSQELYSEPIAAVRELLQNAFDAVLERLAYEWLSQPSEGGQSYSDLERGQSVSLEFEYLNGAFRLRCSDTGAGMSKTILRDHLLVSGMSVRRDIERLERRCRQRGRSTGRTAKFGIGVLSYFLLASELSVETRRLQIAGDDEGTGWRFSTSGVGSFGELTKSGRLDPGSVIDLTLRNNLIQKPVEWWSNLREYIRNTLTRIPCHFSLSSSVDGCQETIRLGPGWTRAAQQLTNEAVPGTYDEPSEQEPRLNYLFRNSAAEKKQHAHRRSRGEIVRDAGARMRWHIGSEFEIDGIGRARIHVPYFELASGQIPVFVDEELADGVVAIRAIPQFFHHDEDSHCLAVDGDLLLSWKGMSIHARVIEERSRVVVLRGGGPAYGVTVEIDIESDSVGRLGLSREWVQFPKDTTEWSLFSKVSHRAREERHRQLESLPESTYASLTKAFLHRKESNTDRIHWLRYSDVQPLSGERHRFIWEKVHFPLIKHDSLWGGEHGEWGLQLSGEHATAYSEMFCADISGGGGRGLFLPKVPSRLVGHDLGERGILRVPVWDMADSLGEIGYDGYALCRLPTQWQSWIGVSARGAGVVWNQDHPLMAQIDWNIARQLSRESVWNLPADKISEVRSKCEDKDFARAVFLNVLRDRQPNQWNGLVEHEPQLAQLIWRSIGGTASLQCISQVVEQNGTVKNEEFIYTRSGVTKNEGVVIQRPGEGWLAVRERIATS